MAAGTASSGAAIVQKQGTAILIVNFTTLSENHAKGDLFLFPALELFLQLTCCCPRAIFLELYFRKEEYMYT